MPIFPYIPPDPTETAQKALNLQMEKEQIADMQQRRQLNAQLMAQRARDMQMQEARVADMRQVVSDPNFPGLVQRAKDGTLGSASIDIEKKTLPSIGMPEGAGNILKDMRQEIDSYSGLLDKAVRRGDLEEVNSLKATIHQKWQDYLAEQREEDKIQKQDVDRAGNVAVDASAKLRADPSLWPTLQPRIKALFQKNGLPTDFLDTPTYTKEVDAILEMYGANAAKVGQEIQVKAQQERDTAREVAALQRQTIDHQFKMEMAANREAASDRRQQMKEEERAAHERQWPKPHEGDYKETSEFLSKYHHNIVNADGSPLDKAAYDKMSRDINQRAWKIHHNDVNVDITEAKDQAMEEYLKRHVVDQSEVTTPKILGVPIGNPQLKYSKVWHPEGFGPKGSTSRQVTLHPMSGFNPTQEQLQDIDKGMQLIASGKKRKADVIQALHNAGIMVEE